VSCGACGESTFRLESTAETGLGRALCAACGEPAPLRLLPPGSEGWVLVDPGGHLITAPSWNELQRTALRARSASELLDMTPSSPVQPKAQPSGPPAKPPAPSARPPVPRGAEDEMVLSERDLSPVSDPALKADDDEGERVSLRDVVVVAKRSDPPKRTPSIPPPLTRKAEPTTPERTKPVPTLLEDAEGDEADAQDPARSSAPPPASARPPRAREAEPQRRRGLISAVALFALALVGYAAYGSGNDRERAPSAADRTAPPAAVPNDAPAPKAAALAAADAAVATGAAELSASTSLTPVAGDTVAGPDPEPEPSPASVSTAGSAPPKATTVAAPGGGGATGGSVSAMLERAAKARAAGDRAGAADLYTRVLALHPGDADAHAGLGHLARAEGDLAKAKKHYESALGTSPRFSPALLGLADVEWDLGDKASAGRRYASLLAVHPNPPERARARAEETRGVAPPAPVPSMTKADLERAAAASAGDGGAEK
jgi:tetratricopeptide (TPR) repeat protein